MTMVHLPLIPVLPSMNARLQVHRLLDELRATPAPGLWEPVAEVRDVGPDEAHVRRAREGRPRLREQTLGRIDRDDAPRRHAAREALREAARPAPEFRRAVGGLQFERVEQRFAGRGEVPVLQFEPPRGPLGLAQNVFAIVTHFTAPCIGRPTR